MATTRQILVERRTALQAAMQEAMEQVARSFRNEISAVDRAIEALEGDAQPEPELSEIYSKYLAFVQIDNVKRSARLNSGLTIKQMVLSVLGSHDGGLDASRLLIEINERWGVGLERTSLSPQLSRLRSEKKVELHGHFWTSCMKLTDVPRQVEEPSSERS